MNRLRLVIDAGHGGGDFGAVVGELREKNINISVARKLWDMATACPWLVVHMIRHGDEYASLSERKRLARAWNADLVISLHCNISPTSGQGAVAYHWPTNETTQQLGEYLMARVPPEFARQKNRVIATDGHEWLRRARNVVGNYHSDALLYEMCYLSDFRDREAIQDESVQWEIAGGIMQGLPTYRRSA